MEDLSGDVEKEVTRPVIPKPRRRSIGWTLLFVGDRGRVIRFQKFKGFVITWTAASIIALTAAVCLGYFYYDQSIQNEALENALKLSRQKMKLLRDEKDILLTRVVVLESNRKKRTTVSSATPEKGPQAEKAAPKAKIETPPATVPEKITDVSSTMEAMVGDTDTDPETEAEPDTPPAPAATASTEVVAVDDFFSIVEPQGNRLRVKYKIRNIDPNSNPISGRTFLILKPIEKGPDNWMILPEVALESGKPAQFKNGKSFSITRFKTMRFKAPYQNGQDPYAMATILVYGTNGELLLEKTFSLKL